MPENLSSNQFHRYLDTIRHTLARDIRPTLIDNTARRSADALDMILGRIIEQLRPEGETLGEEFIRQFAVLRDHLGISPMATVDVLGLSTRDQLEREGEHLNRHIAECLSGVSKKSLPEDWATHLADTASQLWESIEGGMLPITITVAGEQVAANSDDVRSKLENYLQQRFDKLPKPVILEFEPYYGGYAKQMVRLKLASNMVLPERLVLRRDLSGGFTGTRSAEEFSVIERVFQQGLPVPKPILSESDESLLGGTFMLMEEILDVTPAGEYFAKDRAHKGQNVSPEFGAQVAHALATLHSGSEQKDLPLERRQQAQKILLEEVSELQQTWQSMNNPSLSFAMDAGFHLLLAHAPALNRPHCLVHADFGMHNYLARDGELVAIVDWELAHEGDPAEDMAMIKMMVSEDVIDWDDFVSNYLAAGGIAEACDLQAVAYHSLLLFSRHAVSASKLRGYYLSGATDNPIAASVASHQLARLQQYQARALKFFVRVLDKV